MGEHWGTIRVHPENATSLFCGQAAVFLQGMTARRATAAAFGFLELNRELPVSKRDGLRDMLWIGARVHFMAGAAGSAMGSLVDVNEMQIAITVAKFGGAG